MNSPKVSVLMAVDNGEKFLRPAMESILSQTFGDFEFLIVDDGSADATGAIVRSYADPRIRLIEAEHAGLTASLNRGGALCRGELIARMDADDIASPERFALQAAWLDAHPEISLVCSNATLIDEGGRVTGPHLMGDAWNSDILLQFLLYRRRAMPIIHPSVMMRREIFERLGGYRDYSFAEDHDFWLRALETGAKFGHINRELIHYRRHWGGVSRSKRPIQASNSVMSAAAHLVRSHTNIDIFAKRPELFSRHRESVRRRLESEYFPVEYAFTDAKWRIVAGERLRGGLALMRGALRHGPRILASNRLRFLESLVQSTAERIESDFLSIPNEKAASAAHGSARSERARR
ncbi:glycosyltransferase [Rhodoblastus acidophilus]|uniref:Glycosyltransferase n=1 Tax=Candidatus Rhodoblastus alkanivorans TaxID=2954117 RepID=A0ABS9Z769_9HYPH|nr:glycosyltransferase [Candidatus Rhodoblastus alkanivorans]MCI4679535.1 glycosyltransferase [Candidatus Rhodoblastus alkanivorans]MCI4683286.1 glycosyltransferase [Candidatus Rhodoblastus alkanivorans]MDI4640598.1 glycosyltransferase [Rhodoblastus acidophilus]